MNWSLGDYLAICILILVAALTYRLTTSRLRSRSKKIWVGILVVAVFLYIWAELAVGIFTNFGS